MRLADLLAETLSEWPKGAVLARSRPRDGVFGRVSFESCGGAEVGVMFARGRVPEAEIIGECDWRAALRRAKKAKEVPLQTLALELRAAAEKYCAATGRRFDAEFSFGPSDDGGRIALEFVDVVAEERVRA